MLGRSSFQLVLHPFVNCIEDICQLSRINSGLDRQDAFQHSETRAQLARQKYKVGLSIQINTDALRSTEALERGMLSGF